MIARTFCEGGCNAAMGSLGGVTIQHYWGVCRRMVTVLVEVSPIISSTNTVRINLRLVATMTSIA